MATRSGTSSNGLIGGSVLIGVRGVLFESSIPVIPTRARLRGNDAGRNIPAVADRH
jgi:hypothetical protein